MTYRKIAALAAALSLLLGCSAQPSGGAGINEVLARENTFTNYPQTGKTYLSFSKGHGFQVNYIGQNGKAWLWYPGNRVVLPEVWKLAKANSQSAMCWRHPQNSYNPVTKQNGGDFACAPLALQQKANVAVIDGDTFNLQSGKIPYVLKKCTAPDAFTFDRSKFKC